MSYSIGGADGPTSVFVAGSLGWDWINFFGLIIIVLMMLPNIIYAICVRGEKKKVFNKGMNLLEQAGRYASVFLMIFNIGIAEFGFSSVNAFLIYGIGNILLLISYWLIWMLYFIKQERWKRAALAIIPVCTFIISGVTLGHVLLVISGIAFGIGHIYITCCSTKE